MVLPRLAAYFLHEMAHQQRNVLAPIPQRRRLDRKHVQAVIQIRGGTALPAALLQIPIGGGDHRVGLERLRPPTARTRLPATPAIAWLAGPAAAVRPPRRETACRRWPTQTGRSLRASAPVKGAFS